MVTVHREGGFRFVINDHEPAHVHAIKDGEMIVDLVGAGHPRVRRSYRMTKTDARRALQIVATHRDYLLGEWYEIHNETD